KTEMNLKIAGGLWDDSPTRGTAELTLGQISLNLSQSLLKRDALSWDIGESAGIGGYYSVFHYVTGQTDPSFPANVTLNSKIVAQLSPKVLLTATLGAYAMLVHKFNSPDDLHAGVTASLAAEFAGRVTMGIQLQGEEQITFSSNPAYVKTAQLTAFLKFLLSKHAGVAQSLVVSVTASYDEENPAASGLPNESVLAGLQYVVAF
ncbi:MAG: hypothetical protein ACXVBW_09850, partial [Bdellovibrionota bacterium]